MARAGETWTLREQDKSRITAAEINSCGKQQNIHGKTIKEIRKL
jgi:hypothetical protein